MLQILQSRLQQLLYQFTFYKNGKTYLFLCLRYPLEIKISNMLVIYLLLFLLREMSYVVKYTFYLSCIHVYYIHVYYVLMIERLTNI